jgi:hypothetical protein
MANSAPLVEIRKRRSHSNAAAWRRSTREDAARNPHVHFLSGQLLKRISYPSYDGLGRFSSRLIKRYSLFREGTGG